MESNQRLRFSLLVIVVLKGLVLVVCNAANPEEKAFQGCYAFPGCTQSCCHDYHYHYSHNEKDHLAVSLEAMKLGVSIIRDLWKVDDNDKKIKIKGLLKRIESFNQKPNLLDAGSMLQSPVNKIKTCLINSSLSHSSNFWDQKYYEHNGTCQIQL